MKPTVSVRVSPALCLHLTRRAGEAHGTGASAVAHRDLIRYYDLIERAQKDLRQILLLVELVEILEHCPTDVHPSAWLVDRQEAGLLSAGVSAEHLSKKLARLNSLYITALLDMIEQASTGRANAG